MSIAQSQGAASQSLRSVLSKGALIRANDPSDRSQRLEFQYNPESLSRTLSLGGQNEPGDGRTWKGPPSESITLDIEFDATDDDVPGGNSDGVRPALAVIESLLYPTTDVLRQVNAQALQGKVAIFVAPPPLTFFEWGRGRVSAVRITEAQLTEEAFDDKLVPLRAKVKLTLRTLTLEDLGLQGNASQVYMSVLAQRDALALKGFKK